METSGIFSLYSVRWQIEIIFRAWKQSSQLVKALARRSNPFHLQCLMYGAVLLLILTMKIAALLRGLHRRYQLSIEKIMARVGEEFPLECTNCGGDIRLIAFITEPGPIRKILTHLGEPLEPPPVSPCRGPPTDWGELVQAHDDREAVQVSPDELPVIDIHGL